MWLTWVTVTSTPDTEAARDPTDEYFNDRGIQVILIKLACFSWLLFMILPG